MVGSKLGVPTCHDPVNTRVYYDRKVCKANLILEGEINTTSPSINQVIPQYQCFEHHDYAQGSRVF